jgi:hypothetical protein
MKMEERMEEIKDIIRSWQNCEKDSEDACIEIASILNEDGEL